MISYIIFKRMSRRQGKGGGGDSRDEEDEKNNEKKHEPKTEYHWERRVLLLKC